MCLDSVICSSSYIFYVYKQHKSASKNNLNFNPYPANVENRVSS